MLPLRLGLLALNVLAMALCAGFLRSQQQEEDALSTLQATNTASLLARGAAATLDKAKLAVDTVADRVEADLSGTGLRRADLPLLVNRAVERVPDLQVIGLFDQTGAQICHESDKLCRGLNVADRDYFRRYRADPTAGPGIFGPLDSRLDGRRVLILARVLKQGDGSFAGVAIGLLPLQRLDDIVATASLGPGGVASLRVAGPLTLLARAPSLPSDLQARHLESLSAAVGDRMQRSPEAGVFSTRSVVDGETRINAYQKLPGYPIYAFVGDVVATSQDWWRSLLFWAIGFLVVFAGSSVAIERAVSRSRTSERRAQALFDEAPCGYHTLDDQGRFVTINATELAWIGRRRDDVIGKVRAADFLTDEGRATFGREFPRLLAGETVRGLEYDLVGSDGRLRRVSVDAAPMFDDKGRFVSSNTVMHDISALHEARQALQQQNARQQLLLDNKLVGIAQVRDRRFVWVNSAFEGLFGYAPAEMVGQETSILYPDTAAFTAMGEAAAAAFAKGGKYRATVELRRKDGSQMWADCSGAVLDGTGGEVIWFSTDVTEARRAESLRVEAANLAAENRQLQETARLHSLFLSNMSHELRTPLNAVIGFVQILQIPAIVSDVEKRARYLAQIGASGKHLLDMIDSLLDLAKVESGRVPLQPEQLEPHAVIQEVVDMLEGKAGLKGVALHSESAQLPQVRLDPLRLKQVLLNYLSNAIKCSHANGQIVLRAFMSGPERLRIEVQDDGIGIAEADQAQLFVRFRQLSAGATKAYEGTGIGLALVKQIVEAQGGRVGVRSELGKGSVFWAEWPVEA